MANSVKAIRSFKPIVIKPAKPLYYKEADAKFIGFEEPTWPAENIQSKWSKDEYGTAILAAFRWYTQTQDDSYGHDLAVKALNLSGHFPELIQGIKSSKLLIPHTAAWLIRMAQMGLILHFHEQKVIVRSLHKCLNHPKISAKTEKSAISKPNIQDFIKARLHKIQGEIDLTFDQFIESGFKKSERTIMNILTDSTAPAPGNRTKDLIEYATPFLAELKLAQSGKNDQITEAYDSWGTRNLKAAINWWETVIADITNFSQLKKTTRKSRKTKAITPEKVVSKLRYQKTNTELELESIAPVKILKSTSFWSFNTKTRKLGHFVALPNSTFDIKGNKILNVDPSKSIQKTIRKPKEMLAEFMGLTSAKQIKWFTHIRAVETKLRDGLNSETLLLTASK